jgi:predicted MPP superfamily phosphohydrolase
LGGPLYVNVGLGTYMFPARFNCRPEITVVRI